MYLDVKSKPVVETAKLSHLLVQCCISMLYAIYRNFESHFNFLVSSTMDVGFRPTHCIAVSAASHLDMFSAIAVRHVYETPQRYSPNLRESY